jgi:polyisoprenoid-binding protein YceI
MQPKSSLMSVAFGILSIAACLPAFVAPRAPQAAPKEITLEADPAQSKVHYAVDSTVHTVHGTFALKRGSIVHFDPETGTAAGEVLVSVTSGDSGNASRDERMHKELLESAKYPEAVFRPTKIEGQVARSGASDVKLRGVITLHGGEHEIVALVHAELTGDHWKGTAKFDLPYVQWGIKDPSNWLLKVKPIVNLELDMAGPATGPN